MSFKIRNCIECKDVLRPDDETLCNRHLTELIRASRPSFFQGDKMLYPQLIRANYIQDPVTKVWKPRSTKREE